MEIKQKEDLRHRLSPERYAVACEGSTEAPWTGAFVHETREGIYKCGVCGQPLFQSEAKFDSGTGWPSFDEAVPNSIALRSDDSLGLRRTEVTCAKCGAHLGHLFSDGPTETGNRYCINSVALDLETQENSDKIQA